MPISTKSCSAVLPSDLVKGPTRNEAAVLYDINRICVEEVPILSASDLEADEVLVNIKKTGICGSDVHYWKHGRIGDFICHFDERSMVLGHESSGIVLAVGSSIDHLAPGDAVALEPGVPCDKCEQCKGGKYNLCPEVKFFATPPINGSLQKVIKHPGRFCFKLPAGVSLEEGALCEPLSVGVYANGKAGTCHGSRMAIFGAGPIGTICSLVALGLGASEIVVVDLDQTRLETLVGLCGNSPKIRTVHIKLDDSGECIANRIKEEILSCEQSRLLDCAIDCCGAESAITAGILVTKNGGRVVLVGMGKPLASLPILQASIREVDLVGVFRYRNTYPTCLKLLSEKRMDVSPLVTHRFEFTQEGVEDAFEHCLTGKNGAIKVMINVD